MHRIISRLRFYSLLPILLWGCTHSPDVITKDMEDSGNIFRHPKAYLDGNYIIQDIQTLDQDATVYLNKRCADKPLISNREQQRLDTLFNQRFFSPWHRKAPTTAKGEMTWSFRTYARHLGFGENQRQHSKEWIEELKTLANLDTYPNAHQKAITLRNTYLRVLPTHKPHFNDSNIAGEGYPFDNLQNSAIWANTPIFVSHISLDQSWVVAELPYAVGWMPMEDIAWVTSDFIEQWETGRYVALTRDKVPFFDKEHRFRFKTHIGAIFPTVGEDNGNYRILLAVGDENKKAVIFPGTVAKSVAALKPLALSQSHMATVINQLLSQAYGWGGLYENRDCSSTLRDLFTPFGIFLPKHSSEQIKTGQFKSLRGIDADTKAHLIKQEGIPFLTLLGKEGHIMLYIGTFNGKPLVFHNFWGIKTNINGVEGREIVGHAAITSLHPGIELKHFDPDKGDVLKQILGMTTLISPTQLQFCNDF